MRHFNLCIKKHIGVTIFCAGLAAILLDLFLGWRGLLSQRIEQVLLACAFLGTPVGLVMLRANYLVKTILGLLAGFCAYILVAIMANVLTADFPARVNNHAGHQHLPANIETAVFVSTFFVVWCLIVSSISLVGGIAIRVKEHILYAKVKRKIS